MADRRRKGAQTREKIKRAALDLFVERGVDGTGVRDIARACDITEGALYRHFTGKDDLVWALFSEPYVAYAHALEQRAGDAHGTRAKIDAMVRGFCAFFDDDPTLFQFLLIVQHRQLDKVTDDMRTPVQVLEDVVRAGVDAGEVRATDAALATAAVLGIVLQAATFHVYGRLCGPMRDHADDLAAMCAAAVGAT